MKFCIYGAGAIGGYLVKTPLVDAVLGLIKERASGLTG
jgi:hypothetical protein